MAIRERQVRAFRSLPPVYERFASSLDSAMVFSFNWDTILETALMASRVPFQMDKHSRSEPPVVPLLKLHGSIDWFSCDHCLRQPWMRLAPIGESVPSLARACEPLTQLERYYTAGMTPWIVLPSFDKLYQVLQYGELWQMIYLWLQNEFTVYIIGFSMRDDDYHTHAIIYPQLVHGAREGYMKVKVVDLAQTPAEEQAIRSRFAHVRNCEFWLDGFSEDCLEFLSS